MKLTHLLPHAGLCFALTLTPSSASGQQQPQPAKSKATRQSSKPKATTPTATAPPASAGAVIVKDWESGPGATRAPQPGDFPATTPAARRVLITTPGPTPTPDGGIEVIDPDNLQTSMVVTKTADGSVVYDCKQGGDHAGHKHAQPQTAPRVEVE